jgi:hypothetical protein
MCTKNCNCIFFSDDLVRRDELGRLLPLPQPLGPDYKLLGGSAQIEGTLSPFYVHYAVIRFPKGIDGGTYGIDGTYSFAAPPNNPFNPSGLKWSSVGLSQSSPETGMIVVGKQDNSPGDPDITSLLTVSTLTIDGKPYDGEPVISQVTVRVPSERHIAASAGAKIAIRRYQCAECITKNRALTDCSATFPGTPSGISLSVFVGGTDENLAGAVELKTSLMYSTDSYSDGEQSYQRLISTFTRAVGSTSRVTTKVADVSPDDFPHDMSPPEDGLLNVTAGDSTLSHARLVVANNRLRWEAIGWQGSTGFGMTGIVPVLPDGVFSDMPGGYGTYVGFAVGGGAARVIPPGVLAVATPISTIKDGGVCEPTEGYWLNGRVPDSGGGYRTPTEQNFGMNQSYWPQSPRVGVMWFDHGSSTFRGELWQSQLVLTVPVVDDAPWSRNRFAGSWVGTYGGTNPFDTEFGSGGGYEAWGFPAGTAHARVPFDGHIYIAEYIPGADADKKLRRPRTRAHVRFAGFQSGRRPILPSIGTLIVDDGPASTIVGVNGVRTSIPAGWTLDDVDDDGFTIASQIRGSAGKNAPLGFGDPDASELRMLDPVYDCPVSLLTAMEDLSAWAFGSTSMPSRFWRTPAGTLGTGTSVTIKKFSTIGPVSMNLQLGPSGP